MSKIEKETSGKTSIYTQFGNENEEESDPIATPTQNKNDKDKPKKYERSFKESWELDSRFSEWVIKSTDNKPFCKFCGVELKARGGTHDLKQHMRTQKHIKHAESIKTDKKYELLKYFEPKIDIISQSGRLFKTETEDVDEIVACKSCGDTIKKEINPFDIELEKQDIINEMENLITELQEDSINSSTKTSNFAFAEMLMSDMNKLPEKVQRKVRMSILQQIDSELMKIES